MSRFLLVTAGSRGDTEPFVSLAYALREAGHDPTVAAPARYRRLAEAYDIDYVGLDDGFLDLQDELPGAGVMTALRGAPTAKRSFERLLEDVAGLGDWATDHVVYHPKTLVAPMIAERQQVPATAVQLIPLYRATRHFPAPVTTVRPPSFLNRASWRLVAGVEAQWRRVIDRLRRDRFGLSGQAPRIGDLIARDGSLDAWSPTLLPAPEDWPAGAAPIGFLGLPSTPWKPPADLMRFLDAGSAPVYVGFGSMVGRDPAALGSALRRALRLAGRRAVVVTGAGGIALDADEDIFVTDEAPHRWLLPRMAAAVHHGGVGTTGSALVAGVPQVIRPFMGDQRFWAERAGAIGVAVSVRRDEPEEFASAISRAIDASAETAAGVATRVRAEPGVAGAVAALTR